MSNRAWRSGRKQPPQQREPQKESPKKTLEDACKELKKNLAAECQARLAAEKKAKDLIQEEEQLALIYGPNWKQGLPKWAYAFNRTRIDEVQEEEFADSSEVQDEEDEEQIIPFPRKSEPRLKATTKTKKAS